MNDQTPAERLRQTLADVDRERKMARAYDSLQTSIRLREKPRVSHWWHKITMSHSAVGGAPSVYELDGAEIEALYEFAGARRTELLRHAELREQEAIRRAATEEAQR